MVTTSAAMTSAATATKSPCTRSNRWETLRRPASARADAGADVEHGLPVPGPENGIPQPAGRRISPSRPVALEIALGGGITELTLVGGPEGGAARAHVVTPLPAPSRR